MFRANVKKSITIYQYQVKIEGTFTRRRNNEEQEITVGFTHDEGDSYVF